MTSSHFPDDLSDVLDGIEFMLLEKNKSYGDSALNPKRIFSKADSVEQIKVRIDDKLSRIQNGSSFENDNDLDDLLGYLVLLKIAMNRQRLESGMKEMLNDLVSMAKDHDKEFRRQEIKQKIMDERDYDNPELHVPD